MIKRDKPTLLKDQREKLSNELKRIQGKARLRILDDSDIEEFNKICRKNKSAKSIRYYSRDGFVPNSYFGKAEISYIERNMLEDGEFVFCVGRAGAKRSHGRGTLLTINGRGV